MITHFNLKNCVLEARHSLLPSRLFLPMEKRVQTRQSAVVILGKAALSTLEALFPPKSGLELPPTFVIAPWDAVQSWRFTPYFRKKGVDLLGGTHPIPDHHSFECGRRFLEFLGSLERRGVKKVDIYLSGGASSLMWVLPPNLTESSLERKLKRLYSKPLSINALNQERMKLCLLKGGRAGQWIKRLNPSARISVKVISDVSPYGPEVVASGPFFEGTIEHKIVADNKVWVERIAALSLRSSRPIRVISKEFGLVEPSTKIATDLSETVLRTPRQKSGLLWIWGCEPLVSLKGIKSSSRGGRLTHIAAEFLYLAWDAFLEGKWEGVFLSSDGVDGASEGAGVELSHSLRRKLKARGPRAFQLRKTLLEAIKDRNTGRFFTHLGAMIPKAHTGTNVQDVIVVFKR